MEAKIYCFVLALQLVSLVSATSGLYATNDGVGVNEPVTGHSPQSAQASLDSKQGIKSMEGLTGLSRIGSSPPNCEHKCYGCTPCVAIQVPTTSKRHSHLGVNYANYEPEGWKCKCGPSLYSP